MYLISRLKQHQSERLTYTTASLQVENWKSAGLRQACSSSRGPLTLIRVFRFLLGIKPTISPSAFTSGWLLGGGG